MTALDLLALLVYTFGAYAFGAILFLSAREMGRRNWAGQPRPDAPAAEPEFVGVAMIALGFVWFLTVLTLTVLDIALPTLDDWLLQLISLYLAFLWPPLIMHVTVAEHAAARDSGRPKPVRAWRRALWPAYLVGVAVPSLATLGFVGVIAIPRGTLVAGLNTSLAAAFTVASVFSVAMSARYAGHAATPRERVGDRAMNILFATTVTLFLLLPVIAFSMNPSIEAIAGRSIEIAAKSLPLAFLFVGAYFQSRFDFFDILLKRGLSLFATIGTLAAFFGLAMPLLRRLEGAAAAWLTALLLLPVVFVLPWIHGRIASVLDRWWLGRRFTTVDAVKHFISTLRSATTEPQLVERAQQALTDIFGAPAIVHLGAAATAPAFTVLQEIPIETPAGVRATFLMGPRTSEAPYFSEDTALLTSLADVFASIVDNLHLQARKQEQEQRAQELSLHASRSELKALRAQINPHFLFNALNAIAGLIHRNPAGADRTIEQLADVFRYALRGSESEWAILDDEIDFVRAYLEVERARFGDRLQVNLNLDRSAHGARVPTMVVQTLVENAVKHGLAELRGTAVVGVDARATGDRLDIAVTDNGPGFTASAEAKTRPGSRSSSGYGLANIRKRLDGYFGADGVLSIDRDGERGLTIVSVSMPFVREVRAVSGAAREMLR